MLDRSQWIAIGLLSGFAYILGKDRESFDAEMMNAKELEKHLDEEFFPNDAVNINEYDNGKIISEGYIGMDKDEDGIKGLTVIKSQRPGYGAESFEAEDEGKKILTKYIDSLLEKEIKYLKKEYPDENPERDGDIKHYRKLIKLINAGEYRKAMNLARNADTVVRERYLDYTLIHMLEDLDKLEKGQLNAESFEAERGWDGKRVFVVSSVDYETDGEDVDLPQDFTFILDEDDTASLEGSTDMQEIADLLVDNISDETGWLVQGFYFQERMPDGTLVDLDAESFGAEDLAYCPRCGLNPNDNQPEEQQKWESDHVKEYGVCNYCMEELIDEGGEEVALQFDEGTFSFNGESFGAESFEAETYKVVLRKPNEFRDYPYIIKVGVKADKRKKESGTGPYGDAPMTAMKTGNARGVMYDESNGRWRLITNEDLQELSKSERELFMETYFDSINKKLNKIRRIINDEMGAESFEAEKKNCGCGQDPCVTYGAEPCEGESFDAESDRDVYIVTHTNFDDRDYEILGVFSKHSDAKKLMEKIFIEEIKLQKYDVLDESAPLPSKSEITKAKKKLDYIEGGDEIYFTSPYPASGYYQLEPYNILDSFTHPKGYHEVDFSAGVLNFNQYIQ